MVKCISEVETLADTILYDHAGEYDESSHGPAVYKLGQIEKQKKEERVFAAITQSWLRRLLFGNQKIQVQKEYLDLLSTFHYPHHQQYLDFMALKVGFPHTYAKSYAIWKRGNPY